ncbi:MAG: NADH-quinone oxidoreductase subunit J [Chthoniobacterales bacterium]|nr:NADH-quinone oxidoreductase subunit J [Chthoniobacterales bacterium]
MTANPETGSPLWQILSNWGSLIPTILLLLALAGFSIARNLIRAALLIALAFLSLGLLFLSLGAEFLAFAQILVYVGAVAMLMLFTILLSRPSEREHAAAWLDGGELLRGFLIGIILTFILGMFIAASPLASQKFQNDFPAQTSLSLQAIGQALIGDAAASFLALAVLLTAALIGAAILAFDERP